MTTNIVDQDWDKTFVIDRDYQRWLFESGRGFTADSGAAINSFEPNGSVWARAGSAAAAAAPAMPAMTVLRFMFFLLLIVCQPARPALSAEPRESQVVIPRRTPRITVCTRLKAAVFPTFPPS